MSKFIATGLLVCSTLAMANDLVEVFFNNQTIPAGVEKPYENINLLFYNLDALSVLSKKMTMELQAPENGKKSLAQFLADYRQENQSGVSVLNLVDQYELDYLPAYVINRQAVVYGAPDLASAIKDYRSWKND